MKNELSITTKTQTVYQVRNGWEWADISISAGTRSGERSNNWVTVTIASSFEAMGYHWGNIGNTPWYEFLHDPKEKHYMMEKLLNGGATSMKEWSPEETVKGLKERIISARRNLEINKSEARAWYTDVDFITTELGSNTFVDELSSIDMFQDEPWEYLVYLEKPWIDNFWKTLWVPFTTALIDDPTLQQQVSI